MSALALAAAAVLAGTYELSIEGPLPLWAGASSEASWVEAGLLVLDAAGKSCSRSISGPSEPEHAEEGAWWVVFGPLSGARILLHASVALPPLFVDVQPVPGGFAGAVDLGPWSMRSFRVRGRLAGPPDGRLCEEPLVFLDAPPSLAHLPPLLGRKPWPPPSTPTPSSARSRRSATRASTPR